MKKFFTVRGVSQAAVLGIVLFLTVAHMRFGIEKAAPIDAYCPFGAVESFFTYVTTGQYLQRIHTSTFIVMGIVLLLTILFGRVFCSYVCPLGTVQEWIRALGKKIGIKKDVELPKSVDRYARYIKYGVLAGIVYLSYAAGDLVFRANDPFNAFMHLGEEFDEKIFGYAIFGAVLLAALFSRSWWCRYLCPLGAFLGIVRKLSPFKIVRDKDSCLRCGKCDRFCPAGLDISKASEVNSADCISCLRCVKDCPKSSLKAKTFGKEIPKRYFGWLVVIVFFVPLAIVTVTPLWQTKAPSNLIESDGTLFASNLRGSNTLQYVLDTTGIPFSVFAEKLGLPADTEKTMKLKDIGAKYGIKNEAGSFLEAEDFRAVIEEWGSRK